MNSPPPVLRQYMFAVDAVCITAMSVCSASTTGDGPEVPIGGLNQKHCRFFSLICYFCGPRSLQPYNFSMYVQCLNANLFSCDKRETKTKYHV